MSEDVSRIVHPKGDKHAFHPAAQGDGIASCGCLDCVLEHIADHPPQQGFIAGEDDIFDILRKKDRDVSSGLEPRLSADDIAEDIQ